MVLAHSLEEGDRTQDVQISQSVTFESMLLTPNTLQGLKNSGFYRPSPIQLHGIPLGKCGFDLILEAKSGTGKTAVFSIIALEKLDLSVGLQTVILAPTREIAAQICDVIKQLGSSYEGLVVEVVMGGIPVEEDINKFRDKRVHIVVGSPGRLRHLIQDKYIDASAIRLFVLDEADKLMEKSFLPDINFIFSSSPKQKQVVMSSATYPETTKSFIEQYLQSGQHVCPDSNSILLGIKQKLTVIKYNSNIVKQTKNRFEELQKILSHIAFKQCLIFCNYQVRVAELHKMLTKHNWPAEQLYGQQEQLDRLDALKSLQEYKCRILISTDLAARGIDASNVDLVINFEPPFEWQTFLHRIGRAGRFGSYGVAITMLSAGKEEQKFCELLKALKFPLNVSNLWEDEQCVSDTTNQSELQYSEVVCTESLITNDSKESYKEFWNALSSDFKPGANSIESFSNLYDSFKNPSIESFSDLMSSLEIQDIKSQENVMNSTYNQMPMPVNIYLKSINITKEDTNEDVPNMVKDELNNNNVSSLVASNITKSPAPKDDHILITNKRCSLNGRSNQSTSNNNIDQITPDKYKDYSSKEYKIPNTNEALLKAGLPTAFGKCKRKIIKSYSNDSEKSIVQQNSIVSSSHEIGSPSTSEQEINKNIYLINEIENKEIENLDTHGNCNNIKESKHIKQITKISHHAYNLGHNSKSCQHKTFHNSQDGYTENNVEFHVNLNNLRKSNKYSKKTSEVTCNHANNENKDFGLTSKKNRVISKSDQFETYHNSHNKYTANDIEYINENDVSNYINWYKNLKNNVKQLQFSIYINELSKG